MVIRRGQIWWADLGSPRGAEPGYRHPVLVLQRDEVNRSTIETVVVAALTSNLRLARAPGNVSLPRRASGLPEDSVVNASQIATIKKSDRDEVVGALPRPVMRTVDEGLRWFLELERD